MQSKLMPGETIWHPLVCLRCNNRYCAVAQVTSAHTAISWAKLITHSTFEDGHAIYKPATVTKGPMSEEKALPTGKRKKTDYQQTMMRPRFNSE